jgi:hypothetical protein
VADGPDPAAQRAARPVAYSFLVGNPASLFLPPAASDPATAARARFKGAGYRARTRAAVRHAKSRATRVAKTAKAHRAFLVRQGKQK